MDSNISALEKSTLPHNFAVDSAILGQNLWAAGLFEGEGCISSRNGRSYLLCLQMTDEDVVKRFADWAGVGKFRARPVLEGYKPVFEWRTSHRRDVQSVLNRLLPHLGARRAEKAREALISLMRVRKWGGR